MAHSEADQQSRSRVPASTETTSQSEAQALQPTTEHPSTESKGTQQPSGAKIEEKLARDGKLPGLEEVQHSNETDVRQPGEEDEAGNKIHHKNPLKKMLHWEHNAMNAD
ncbi:MAG: hypothetical protein LQ351_007345 [Letrouitia transgressa]|nr:MAG: hypothetical protein LQ351_007345 [Letrouitia transgressa]